VVHDLYASDAVRDLVVARWGEEVAPGGVVDRAAVARRAFASDEERAWLESEIWPRVGAAMLRWREEAIARTPPPRALVVETPLLFEAGLEPAFDATIVVDAEEAQRRERAVARGHEALDERAARQLSPEEKARRATHVADNRGSLEDLEVNLSAILEKLTG
jgi:dephospho-CoA kinase